jgi:hypothetical protein
VEDSFHEIKIVIKLVSFWSYFYVQTHPKSLPMPQKHSTERDFSIASSFLAAGVFSAVGKELEDGSK